MVVVICLFGIAYCGIGFIVFIAITNAPYTEPEATVIGALWPFALIVVLYVGAIRLAKRAMEEGR